MTPTIANIASFEVTSQQNSRPSTPGKMVNLARTKLTGAAFANIFNSNSLNDSKVDAADHSKNRSKRNIHNDSTEQTQPLSTLSEGSNNWHQSLDTSLQYHANSTFRTSTEDIPSNIGQNIDISKTCTHLDSPQYSFDTTSSTPDIDPNSLSFVFSTANKSISDFELNIKDARLSNKISNDSSNPLPSQRETSSSINSEPLINSQMPPAGISDIYKDCILSNTTANASPNRHTNYSIRALQLKSDKSNSPSVSLTSKHSSLSAFQHSARATIDLESTPTTKEHYDLTSKLDVNLDTKDQSTSANTQRDDILDPHGATIPKPFPHLSLMDFNQRESSAYSAPVHYAANESLTALNQEVYISSQNIQTASLTVGEEEDMSIDLKLTLKGETVSLSIEKAETNLINALNSRADDLLRPLLESKGMILDKFSVDVSQRDASDHQANQQQRHETASEHLPKKVENFNSTTNNNSLEPLSYPILKNTRRVDYYA